MMAFLLTFVINYPAAQIMLMMVNSLVSLTYLITFKPFESNVTNTLEIVNEVFIMVSVYHLIGFSDFVTDPYLKYYIGWSINLLVVLQILINTFVISGISLLNLFKKTRYCGQRIFKHRLR